MKPSDTDPRVERSRALILEATLDELAEQGYDALTIEGVARRARVGKATVYRHWDGKLDLVADAVVRLKQVAPAPEGVGHRERIVSQVRATAEHLATSRLAACLPTIIDASQRHEEVREFHHRTSAAKRAHLIGLLDEARTDGHLPDEVDTTLLAELLAGPLFLRRLMTADPFPPDDVEHLVETVLDPYWI